MMLKIISKLLDKAKDCILSSNRYKHLLYGLLIGMLADSWYSVEYCAVFTSGALELKDKLNGKKFDWIDFIATIIGFNLGFILRLGILILLFE